MKAMILAAGLGTRLRPFTNDHPKALFPVNGKPLLRIAVEHLQSIGITEIIVNVHHFANQIVEYLHQNKYFGCRIAVSDETGELLETGGGLKKAAWFFDDGKDFLVRNVDIVSDLDLRKMALYHLANKPIATLAVRKRETARYFLMDGSMKLAGWENTTIGEKRLMQGNVSPEILSTYSRYAFSGIQIINPALFGLIKESGKFSLTNLYLRISTTNTILGYLEDGLVWNDVGTMT